MVYTLSFRAYKICSDFFSLHEELQFLKKTLQLNGYIIKFIENCIGKILGKLHKPYGLEEVLNYDVPKDTIYFSCIYFGEISQNVLKDLQTIVSQSYPQVKLLSVFKSHSHFCFKDKQPQT